MVVRLKTITRLLLRAISHPLRAMRFSIIWLNLQLKISETAKASNKGERLVVKSWESVSGNSDFTTLAHLQRYKWVLPQCKTAQVLLDDGCGTGYGSYYLAVNSVWA